MDLNPHPTKRSRPRVVTLPNGTLLGKRVQLPCGLVVWQLLLWQVVKVRLGYNGPKGTYPVTPVTEKTLFQVFAEKIARSGERFDVIPWYSDQ